MKYLYMWATGVCFGLAALAVTGGPIVAVLVVIGVITFDAFLDEVINEW